MPKELTAKPIIKQIYDNLEQIIPTLSTTPHLALIAVGENPASQFYIRNIIKRAEKLGIKVTLKTLNDNITEQELLNFITQYNDDQDITAIMLQKPLPSHINENYIASSIASNKDVDGFTPINLGKLMIEEDSLTPCTPAAVMSLIQFYGIELAGKHTVLCGRSLIVGKPLLNLLIRKDSYANATVTLCHSRTKELSSYTKQADILITALGIPRFIKSDMIKEGVVVIDVGTNEIVENDKTIYVGDVDYEECYAKVSAITPVPGGIGSITTAILMENIVKAAEL